MACRIYTYTDTQTRRHRDTATDRDRDTDRDRNRQTEPETERDLNIVFDLHACYYFSCYMHVHTWAPFSEVTFTVCTAGGTAGGKDSVVLSDTSCTCVREIEGSGGRAGRGLNE